MGMVAAWIHPQIESSWAKIDSLGSSASNLCRMAILLCCLVLLFIWYTYVYTLEKLEYNLLHPYTSWVPISLWVIVRNVTPQLRQRALALLSWLGCITLETYVSQFHIWLRSNIPNGQPKYLLELVRSPEYVYAFLGHIQVTCLEWCKSAHTADTDICFEQNLSAGSRLSTSELLVGINTLCRSVPSPFYSDKHS